MLLSRVKVNSAAIVHEKLKYDGMDTYFSLLQVFEDGVEVRVIGACVGSVLCGELIRRAQRNSTRPTSTLRTGVYQYSLSIVSTQTRCSSSKMLFGCAPTWP